MDLNNEKLEATSINREKVKEVFNEYINALIESRKNIKVILEEENFLFDSKENYEKAYDNYVYATALLREIENEILE